MSLRNAAKDYGVDANDVPLEDHSIFTQVKLPYQAIHHAVNDVLCLGGIFEKKHPIGGFAKAIQVGMMLYRLSSSELEMHREFEQPNCPRFQILAFKELEKLISRRMKAPHVIVDMGSAADPFEASRAGSFCAAQAACWGLWSIEYADQPS